ncbi:hypothetical protein [Rhodopseudomonas sp. P2A-2r]|uniref:hypothetical protein n=1 Tax=unclassified Rhodopseudomonas TaxID=2638247 RepID=UPI0022345498|nr:hypothetical protein [Rhodopseudomonas sp. P2A-2r]UZE50865.1 hypothetical protein ONR75_09675 [Rhodopseudomonas sp. P2A-2r]
MPRSCLKLLTAALLMAVIGSSAARAEDEPKQIDTAASAAFDAKLFAGTMDADMTYACFERRYDTAHLAQHGRQKVSAMKLLVIARRPSAENREPYSFKLGFKYRDRKGDWDSSGYCNRAQNEYTDGELRMTCSVECDGGGISVGLPKDGDGALVRVERVRIWQNAKPDDETSQQLEGGSDDRMFRLQRTALKGCESLVEDADERAAMRQK